MTERRRQRGEGALFQRADGLWVGRVELGWVNGRRKRKVVYARTQAAAMRKLREATRAVEQGNRSTTSQTLATWLATWLREVVPGKPRMRPNTIKNYETYVRCYLIPAIGKVRVDQLAPQHVRELHRFVAGKELSSTTMLHAHRTLGAALNDALREGLLARNPVSLVPAPAASGHTRRALTIPEVRDVFAVAEGDRLESTWHAAFLLGLRQGERLGLQWDRLDLDAGNATADVAAQLQRIPYKHGCGGRACEPYVSASHCPERVLAEQPGFEYKRLTGNLCLVRPKTKGSTRLVPLPEPLRLSLAARYSLYVAERGDYITDYGLVWCRPDGMPLRSADDTAAWHALLAAAGVEGTDQHSARHTTATLLLAIGTPEHVIMSILGHTLAVTTRGYTHVDLTLQRQALSQLGNALQSGLARTTRED